MISIKCFGRGTPPELEKILLKHWLQLPEVISQLYYLLICFLPEKLFLRNDLNLGKQFEPWIDAAPDISKREPSFHCFSWFSRLDDAASFYPQTKNVLKVFKQTGEILPKNLDEMLALYKEGLQPGASDFEYFFKFLEENKTLIEVPAISEVTWRLLVYNPPFLMSLLKKASHPETEEDWRIAATIG